MYCLLSTHVIFSYSCNLEVALYAEPAPGCIRHPVILDKGYHMVRLRGRVMVIIQKFSHAFITCASCIVISSVSIAQPLHLKRIQNFVKMLATYHLHRDVSRVHLQYNQPKKGIICKNMNKYLS